MTEDRRDLRDPQKMGEKLLAARAEKDALGVRWKMSDIYDSGRWDIPNYDSSETLGSLTAQEYRRELEERAAAGDRYAASMLKGQAYEEPSDV